MHLRSILAILLSAFDFEYQEDEQFEIYGKLTCDGYPAGDVQILMVQDTFSWFDRILNFRKTNKNGHFRMIGQANQPDIDIMLIIEHSCHENLKLFSNEKAKSYTELHIDFSKIRKNDDVFEMNIELREHSVKNSIPFLYIWRVLADFRTVLLGGKRK
ncbi:unnamed protein product [Caenorhabditis angaria]|uniref:Galectin n=1 Tax=Caenorhabditis angaria TaxID=860376 RepID=A0A9P1ID85_9PELO|nr:unnamed protein product [Caenorhabditis angaria]